MSQNLLPTLYYIVCVGQGASFRYNALRHRCALIKTAKSWCAIKNLPLWAEHCTVLKHPSCDVAGSKRRKESAINTLLRWVVFSNKAQT